MFKNYVLVFYHRCLKKITMDIKLITIKQNFIKLLIVSLEKYIGMDL